MHHSKKYRIKCIASNLGVIVVDHVRYEKGRYCPITNYYTNRKPANWYEFETWIIPEYINQVKMWRKYYVYENENLIKESEI